MKDFGKILQTYMATDGLLASQELRASLARDKQSWQNRRLIHDQAYFVMLFAQMEDFIKAKCEKLIAKKRGLAKWKSRRLWDTVDFNRLPFRQRVALLTEKGQADYNKITEYYRVRNGIAHGTLAAALPVAIPQVASEIQSIVNRLRSA